VENFVNFDPLTPMNDTIEKSVFALRVVCLSRNTTQQRTYWCRRLAIDSELAYSAVICMAVALKKA